MEDVQLKLSLDTSDVPKNLDKVRDDLDGFEKRTKESRSFLLSVRIAELQRSLEAANKLIKDAKKQGDVDGEIKLRANVEILKQNLTSAKGQLRNFLRTGQEDVSVLGKLFAGLGGKLQVGITSAASGIGSLLGLGGAAGIGSALLSAADKAYDFNVALTRIGQVSGATKSELSALGEEIKGISKNTGLGSVDLANAAKDIAAAGVPLQQLGSVLTSTAEFAVSSGTDIKTAFDGLFATASAYGIALTDLTQIEDKFFAANAAGKVDIEGISANIGSVAPLAAAAGVSLNELATAYATLVGVTGNEAAVSTELQAIFTALVAPAEEAKKAFNALGIEYGAAAIKSKGFINVIKEIQEKTGGNAENIKALIPRVEALNAVIQLGGQSFDTYNKNLETVRDSFGLTQKKLEEFKDTNEFTLKQSQVIVENAALGIGEALVSLGAGFIRVIDTIGISFKAGIAIIGTALISFGEKTVKFFENLGYNISIAFDQVPERLAQGLQLGLGVIDDFANLVAGKVNQLSQKLGKGDLIGKLDLSGIIKVDKSKLDGKFRPLDQGFDEINTQVDKIRQKELDRALGTTAAGSATQKVLKDEAKSRQELLDKTKAQIEAEKRATDARAKLDASKKTGGGGGDSPAVKALKKQAEAEIAAVKKSVLSEEAKAKAIVKINDKLQIDILIATGKRNEAEDKIAQKTLDNIKEKKKEEEDAYKDTTSEIENGIDKLADYAKKIKDLKKEFSDLRKQAGDDIRGINNDLAEIGKKSAQEQIDRQKKLGDREIDAVKELADIKAKLEEQRLKGATQTLAESIGKETLNLAPAIGQVGDITVQDLRDTLDLLDQQKKLELEIATIKANASASDIKAAEDRAKRSGAQVIIDESAEQQKQLAKEKKTAEEKLAIAQSVSSGKLITLQGEGETLKAYYTDQKGQLQAITEFENSEYAIQIGNKQAALTTELNLTLDSFNKQQNALRTLDLERRTIEEEYTQFIGDQLALRGKDLDAYQAKLNEAKSALQAAGLPTVFNTTNATAASAGVPTAGSSINFGGISISKDVDAESLLRSISKLLP